MFRHCRRLIWAVPIAWAGLRYRLSRARREHRILSNHQLDQIEWGRLTSTDPIEPAIDAQTDTIRVSSWNIAGGRKYQRVLEAMRDDLAADIYLLQEVDSGCRRSGYGAVARRLAQELSLHYVFGIEFQELAQQGPERPAVHGQAILSRFPILQARLLRFRHQPADWSEHPVQPRRGARMSLVADIQIGGQRLMVYSAHLESRGDEQGRARQMQEMLADVQRNGHPGTIVIAGDLNTKGDRPGRPSPIIDLARSHRFHDALAKWKPERGSHGVACLDWILIRGLTATAAPVHRQTRASDHEPVSVDLRWTSITAG